MNLLTIILFFVYTFGLGYTACSITKTKPENLLERIFSYVGVGIGVFIVIGVILNLLHVPIDWKLFLLLSLIFPIYDFFKNKENIKEGLKAFKLNKSSIYLLIVLCLALFSFYMYHTGAFAYPYLEDDDPWEHARSVSYISTEKTAFEPDYAKTDLFRYIDPYPPGYEILMAVLYQTSDSINWTLKFFNALIISLSIILFYLFAKEFTKNKNKALIAAFVIAVIPCYLSHFIWVHSLIPLLFFVAFYCLEMSETDKRWSWLAGIIIAAIFVVSADQAIKFCLFFAVYFIVKWIMSKKLPLENIKAAVLGSIVSLSWWAIAFKEMIMERVGRIEFINPGLIPKEAGFFSKASSFISTYFNPYSGSATRPYTFEDFFIAKSANMINNPVGVGIMLSITAILSIVLILLFFKKYIAEKKSYAIIALGWLLLTFLMVNSATFNIPGLISFRTWMLFAIPIALLIAEGLTLLMLFAGSSKILKISIIAIFVLGAIFTSGVQKYELNTVMWPPGGAWTSMDEFQLYLWALNLPKETRISSFSGDQDNHLIGLDMWNCDWCPEYLEFRKDFINKTPSETHAFLKSSKYQYFILDPMSVNYFVEYFGNNTNTVISEKFQEYINANDKFSIAFQNNAGVVLRVL
jgi:4-amino-4-deoxy-L-arabinose transferase-like glycosyltransferase